MKTILRTTCSVIGTLVIFTSVFADNSVTLSSSSELSKISVKIGAKMYSGDEAKTYLLGRVKTMKEARKTTEEQKIFIEQFITKLSKLAGAYEKKSGSQYSDVAKVLRAIENELKKDVSGSVDNTRNNSTIVTVTTATDSDSLDKWLQASLKLAKNWPQSLYVKALYDVRGSMPQNWWKDKDEAYNYIINVKYHAYYLKWPKGVSFVINQAVTDGLAWRVGAQYLEEAFKTLPTDFSTETSSTTSSSYPLTVTTATDSDSLNTWLQESLALAKTSSQIYYVTILFETRTYTPQNWWKNEDEAINFILKMHASTIKKFPIDATATLKLAVRDSLAWKVWAKYLEEAFKTFPSEFKE